MSAETTETWMTHMLFENRPYGLEASHAHENTDIISKYWISISSIKYYKNRIDNNHHLMHFTVCFVLHYGIISDLPDDFIQPTFYIFIFVDKCMNRNRFLCAKNWTAGNCIRISEGNKDSENLI